MLAFLRMTNNAISGGMHKARRLANDHQRELTIVAVTLLTYITYSLLTEDPDNSNITRFTQRIDFFGQMI